MMTFLPVTHPSAGAGRICRWAANASAAEPWGMLLDRGLRRPAFAAATGLTPGVPTPPT